ncbi:MAG: hypothetical protein WEA56_03600 [Balneolaceae bacterium]
MRKEKKIALLAGFIFLAGAILPVYGQNTSPVELDLQAVPAFSEAQVINFVSLAFDGSGQGERMFNLALQNIVENSVSDIYIEYFVSSTRAGLIFESYQDLNTPFTIQPGQVVLANNNDLAASRLRGISHPVNYYGELTSAGRDLMNRLQGGSSLPADAYTITMNVYQHGTSETGGQFLTSSSATIGENLFDDDFSIFLLGPGDIPGSGVTIINQYPEFRWDGRLNQTYRLVVVKEVEGESPSALIESALSTNPSFEGGSANLLQFEHLDVLVNGTHFQYPPSGAQALQTGEQYYWQVFATLNTSSGEEILSSEIWSFILSDGSYAQGTNTGDFIEVDDELFALLAAILGESKAVELEENGFQLEAIEIEGSDLRGGPARSRLEDLLDKVREGSVKFTINP